MTFILCDVEKCQYHIFYPENPYPYRHQCTIKELEIDWDGIQPICFSFKRKAIKKEKISKGMKITKGIK